MRLGITSKQPIEKLSYSVSYKDALTAGDNVDTATVVSVPAGLTITNVGVFDPLVKFWVAGGINNTVYKTVITVSTSDGRIFQDDLVVKVKET